MCRSRRELSNAYLLAKIGVDTAENEPLEVWGENSIHYSLHSLVPTVRAVVRQRAALGKDRIRRCLPPVDAVDLAMLFLTFIPTFG